MAKNSVYYNREGYFDPTAGKAICNLRKSMKPKKIILSDKPNLADKKNITNG